MSFSGASHAGCQSDEDQCEHDGEGENRAQHRRAPGQGKETDVKTAHEFPRSQLGVRSLSNGCAPISLMTCAVRAWSGTLSTSASPPCPSHSTAHCTRSSRVSGSEKGPVGVGVSDAPVLVP